MATITSDAKSPITQHESTRSFGAAVLQMLGSLKLTVALFACSLVIVLVGTLAQDEMNMLEVKQRYFLSWIAMLHIDDFFPQAFFPHERRFRGHSISGGGTDRVPVDRQLDRRQGDTFQDSIVGGRLIGGDRL